MLSKDMRYQVEADFDLSDSMRETLTKLYQPLIGADAFVLYFSLLSMKKGSFQELADMVNFDLPKLERARIKLEEASLLVTYLKDQHYLLCLNAPLEYRKFLYHDVFGRLLILTMGIAYYENCLKANPEIDKSEYTNISAKMDKSILYRFTKAQEERFSQSRALRKNTIIDQNELFTGISAFRFPYEHRTQHNINAILEIAELYELPLEIIKELYLKAYDSNTNSFDIEDYKRRVRNKKFSKENAISYQIACVDFLRRFQNSGAVSDANAKALEKLKNKYNLANEVINVIVEYCLKQHDMKLIWGIIDTIAAEFDRLKINDYQAALKQISSSRYKKSSPQKKITTPSWMTTKRETKSGKIKDEEYDPEAYSKAIERLSKK